MQSNSILKLPLEIKKGGFIYRQCKHEKNKYIYAQFNKLGEIVSYEVFLNKLGNLRKAKERWAKLQNKSFNPEDYQEFYEIFPSDEEFGKRAWTYKTLDEAELAFHSE